MADIRYNDPFSYPYGSERRVMYANNGMVATSQPLAAQAGLEMIRKGGNAVDAAVAAAVCLTVVEPGCTGIGGDAFALVWHGGKLRGLNSSGPAPAAISESAVRKRGYDSMPEYGWIPVNVPGAPAAWAELSGRFGRLPLETVMEPAIQYAFEGYPVSPLISEHWESSFKLYSRLKGDEFGPWSELFAPNGKTPEAGEIWRSEDMARTLSKISKTGAESFYRGETAEKICAFSKRHDGFLRESDLENYRPEWTDPLKTDYRGYDIWEMPPNTQGMIALMALNILRGFDFDEKETALAYHRQIEAMKLAFADGKKHITDKAYMSITPEILLSKEYADDRRALISDRALEPCSWKPCDGSTVYLAAADSEGGMVSYIQSNYMGFGSGIVVPGTGISLHNRGHTFSLDPTHANYLEPGKKTYHTIIPGFITKGVQAIGPFGVMGGFMQPQGHVQSIMNMVDFGLNPQAALDAPRWQWIEGRKVMFEKGVSPDIISTLEDMGHEVVLSDRSGVFGKGQIIQRSSNGVLRGGTDPRADGTAAGF